MPAPTRILLPPSEGKADGGDGPPWEPGSLALPDLDRARARVLRALGRGGPRRDPTMPAIERYTGVLYRELDAASLPATARRRLHRSTLIVSGLWGAVAPADPVPAYRLKMSASVAPLGKLSTWWRPQLTDALGPWTKGAVVWDLLPNEHAAAIDWTALAPRPTGHRPLPRPERSDREPLEQAAQGIDRALARGRRLPRPVRPRRLRPSAGLPVRSRASDLGADPALVVLRERG